MNFVVDPIWPWSNVWAFLSGVGAWGLAATVLAAAGAFALPVLLYLRPYGLSPRRILGGAGLVLALVLVLVAINTWGMTTGLAWGAQGVGLVALLTLPLALAGLTVWTYLGVTGATPGRVGAVLALRLAAFALALVAMLRPSLAFSDKSQTRTLLLIALDASESMTIRDEINSQSRWELMLNTVRECAPELERLRDLHQVDVVFYRFAADTGEFNLDEPGKADGKRTDMGGMLNYFYENRDGRRPLRGLLVVGDGADTGSRRNPALAEAARWRRLPCPVHTFACGKPTTSDRQSDIAITAIATEPAPVPVKGKLTTKVTVDAPGFENTTVRVRLFLDDKEVEARNEALPLTTGNEVKIDCTAPPRPGEVKVTVRLEDPMREGKAPPGDVVAANNQIETFVSVAKEGISVLLVDKPRVWEPQTIYDALARDPRIRVTPVWLRGDRPADPNGGDLFQFDEKQYDVIILGDVTAKQVRAVNPNALEAIEKLVDRGSGFLMIGGYASFGNSDWQGTPVEKLLPVDLNVRGQDERKVKMVPTEAGLRRYGYVLRLSDVKDQRAAWEQLPELWGMTKLGRSRSGIDSVLATTRDGAPILVTQNYGQGRVLAFGGDTTHRWVRSPRLLQMHGRFWRQMVVWLAKQEDAEGSVWVVPDARRLPARSDLGFRVGVRSRGGIDLKGAKYTVEVVGPGGERTPVPITHDGSEDRGTFARTDAPGEYRIAVRGEASDPSTGEVVSGEASARCIVYDEDLEMARRAADHDFLKKLAAAGGGQFHRVEELPAFLRQLLNQPLARERPKLDLLPDWRTTRRSPFFMGFFGLFVAVLTGEWVLRRRWGLA